MISPMTDSVYKVSIFLLLCYVFFFNDTATTEIYTLSLHDALPICRQWRGRPCPPPILRACAPLLRRRSEEHTSELQSRRDLVCRLLLEKKQKHSCYAEIEPSRPLVKRCGTTSICC